MVCDMCGGGGRRSSPGYKIKNKNPTQSCGEKTVRDGYSTDAAVGLALCIYIYIYMRVKFNPLRIGSCPLSPHSRCQSKWRSQGSATMLIFLERKTPSISTGSALDHSHLARDAKTCKRLQNVCDTYANPLDKNRYYTCSTCCHITEMFLMITRIISSR